MKIPIIPRTQEDLAEAKFHYNLVELGNESLVPVGVGIFVVAQYQGWLVIGPTESIIIINASGELQPIGLEEDLHFFGVYQGDIELAFLCNISNGKTQALYFINSVIDEAVVDWKGVRVCNCRFIYGLHPDLLVTVIFSQVIQGLLFRQGIMLDHTT